MVPEGRGTSGVMIFGEALGEHEEEDRLPFRPYAESGSVLEKAFKMASLQRDQFTLTNCVWYRPKGNELLGTPWEMDAIRACERLNDDLVSRVQPKVILALGAIPFRQLTGMSGPKQGIGLCRGLVCDGFSYPVPVVGAYHPSYLRRGSKERQKDPGGTKSKTVAAGGGTAGMNLLGTLIHDIQLSVQIARDGRKKWNPKTYIQQAPLEEWKNALRDLRSRPETMVFYDLETRDSIQADDESEVERVYTEIAQAQICYGSRVLVSDWFPDLLPVFREIMELPNPKGDWNGKEFDRPILRDHGIRCDRGEWHDLMDLWHFVQPDLPRGLQVAASFVCPEVGPWKHLSLSDSHWYGALDVDVPSRIWDALRGYARLTRSPISGVTLWGGYNEQVARLTPCLDYCHDHGIPVNDAKRMALGDLFDDKIQTLTSELQDLVPDEIKSVEPKEGIKRKSILPQVCLEAMGQMTIENLGGGESKDGIHISDTFVWKPRNKVVGPDGTVYVTRKFKDPKTKTEVERWARLQPFTPNGGEQTLRYIRYQIERDSRGVWYVPTDYKTGKDTTGQAELERLAKKTGDKLIPKILECREVGKAKSTYIDGWAPKEDGLVHSYLGFRPATGQLSSHSPNCQNFPVHAEIAKEMRRIIEARPGKKFIKFDYKSFHVLTTGFEAQDPAYMRMARLDMHSYFALCGILRLESPEKVYELPDQELMEKLGWYKKQPKTYSSFGGLTFKQIRDEKAKRAILGIGFGQGPRSLFMLNPESFKDTRDAKTCLEALDVLFPLPARWRTAVRLEADSLHYLLTRYGYIRRFWDVFQWKPVRSNYFPKYGDIIHEAKDGRRWLLNGGDDSEACIAFRPANDAFGLIRERMVELWETGLAEKYGLMWNLHDDLTFECPREYIDEAQEKVKGILERPSTKLVDSMCAPGGLWCATECYIGPNLEDMERIG